MDNKIKNILIRNSDLLKKNKINFIKLFNNYQTGGGKDFSMFYEELYNKIRVYEQHREFYGLVL